MTLSSPLWLTSCKVLAHGGPVQNHNVWHIHYVVHLGYVSCGEVVNDGKPSPLRFRRILFRFMFFTFLRFVVLVFFYLEDALVFVQQVFPVFQVVINTTYHLYNFIMPSNPKWEQDVSYFKYLIVQWVLGQVCFKVDELTKW